jgi:O-antigen ligase
MYRRIQRFIVFIVGITFPMGLSAKVEGYPLSPSKVAIAMLLILVGMQFALSGDRRFPRDRGVIAVLIFALSVGVSGVVAVIEGTPFWYGVAGASRYLGLVAFYLMLVYVVRTRDDLVLLFWAIVIGGGVTALPALLEIRSGTYLGVGQRSSGLAGKPNAMAYELVICLSIAAALYFTTRRFFRKLLILGFSSLMMVGIVGSLSRSAFLSLGLMWAFWVWRSRRIDTLKYLIPGVALAISLFLVLPEKVTQRINTMVDPAERAEDQSIQSRFDMVIWTGRAFMQSPIVGIGLYRYVPWIQKQPGGAMYENSIHSGFLGILVHQGLLGLVPFLVLVFTTWTDYGAAQRLARSRRMRGDPELQEIGTFALFLQIALVGCMVGAMTHPTSTSKGWWMVMGLSAGIATLARARSAALDAQLATAVEPRRAIGFDYGPGVVPAPR